MDTTSVGFGFLKLCDFRSIPITIPAFETKLTVSMFDVTYNFTIRPFPVERLAGTDEHTIFWVVSFVADTF